MLVHYARSTRAKELAEPPSIESKRQSTQRGPRDTDVSCKYVVGPFNLYGLMNTIFGMNSDGEVRGYYYVSRQAEVDLNLLIRGYLSSIIILMIDEMRRYDSMYI